MNTSNFIYQILCTFGIIYGTIGAGQSLLDFATDKAYNTGGIKKIIIGIACIFSYVPLNYLF